MGKQPVCSSGAKRHSTHTGCHGLSLENVALGERTSHQRPHIKRFHGCAVFTVGKPTDRKWAHVLQRLEEQRMIANTFVRVSIWGDEVWKQTMVTAV